MFDVRGDKIYFNLHPFAQLGGAPWVGHELDAVATLLDYEDQTYMVSDSDHADVARVDALLAALATAHNVLMIASGIVDEGAYRKRPAKVGECKRAMLSAMSTLRLAKITYNAPNGA